MKSFLVRYSLTAPCEQPSVWSVEIINDGTDVTIGLIFGQHDYHTHAAVIPLSEFLQLFPQPKEPSE